MNKKISILLAYFIPIIYIAMLCDIKLKIVFPYFIAVIWLVLINNSCLKNIQFKLFGIGQIINLLVNTLCIHILNHTELKVWCSYFKVRSIWMFPFLIIFILCIVNIIGMEIIKSIKN